MQELLKELAIFFDNFNINSLNDCHKLLYYLNCCVTNEEKSDISLMIYDFLSKQCEHLENNPINNARQMDFFIPVLLQKHLKDF